MHLPNKEGQLAALLALSYHGFLRPGEACRLTREDLISPGDPGWGVRAGMVVIRAPQTARVAARVQDALVHGLMVLILPQWAWLALAPTSWRLAT